ncbi:MAG: CPBP family intramembrane metalloprotease [Bacteroidales bacterium]|nr:CPBP family intramembrane metalloprotease [Bacteroidales bacterium]
MRRRAPHKADFSFWRKFEYYTPGYAGMAGLLLWLVFGALLGSLAVMGMSLLAPDGSLAEYEFLVSYPLMFIPAMMYASFRSMTLQGRVEANPLDGRFLAGGKELSFRVAAVTGFVCVVATLTLAFVAEPIPMLLPDMPEALRQALESVAGGPVLISLLCTSVFAPVCEEWLCRGMILRGLLPRLKPGWAIAVSALFFALIHMNPWQGIPAFLLGCLFGYVYYKTRSLWLTMLMHCANNTAAVVLSNVDSLSDYDYLVNAFDGNKAVYAVLVAACVISFDFCLKYISKCSPVPSGKDDII